jgi:peptide/nickel transport system permease protein
MLCASPRAVTSSWRSPRTEGTPITATYVAKRLLAVVPVLVGVTLVAFLLLQIVPGDPAVAILGPTATAEAVAQLRESLGLNKPVYVQYARWLGKTLSGDMGRSIQMNIPVLPTLREKFANTLILATASFLLAVVMGTGLGLLAAARPHTRFDRAFMSTAVVGASVPSFWIALMLMFVFALKLRLLPATGMYDITGDQEFTDLLRHLVLPATVTAMVPTAIIARMARASLIEVMHQDYIRVCLAKGLPYWKVVAKHGVRNALPPIVNITGLQLGYLLGGAVYTEVVFSWPGIGLQLYSSIVARDIPMVQATVLLVGLGFVLVNVAVDLVLIRLVPRATSAA